MGQFPAQPTVLHRIRSVKRLLLRLNRPGRPQGPESVETERSVQPLLLEEAAGRFGIGNRCSGSSREEAGPLLIVQVQKRMGGKINGDALSDLEISVRVFRRPRGLSDSTTGRHADRMGRLEARPREDRPDARQASGTRRQSCGREGEFPLQGRCSTPHARTPNVQDATSGQFSAVWTSCRVSSFPNSATRRGISSRSNRARSLLGAISRSSDARLILIASAR